MPQTFVHKALYKTGQKTCTWGKLSNEICVSSSRRNRCLHAYLPVQRQIWNLKGGNGAAFQTRPLANCFAHICGVFFLTPGCILHGSCFGVCSCLSPIQNPQGRMFSVIGSLPRSTICSEVSVLRSWLWVTAGDASRLMLVFHSLKWMREYKKEIVLNANCDEEEYVNLSPLKLILPGNCI